MTKICDEKPVECCDPACPCHEWSAKSPSLTCYGHRRLDVGLDALVAPEPENVSEGNSTQSSPIPAAPDFDREWREAPEGHKRYTERSEAEWWLMRGVWLGIQYERERGLVALSGDLKEMQRRGSRCASRPCFSCRSTRWNNLSLDA